jgi:hypothetical protein
MSDPQNLLKLRGSLVRKLGRFREMLPGSFVERKLKCGKPNCACALKNELHTAFQITFREGNKTVTRMIPADLAKDVRKKIDLQKNFNALVKQIQEINVKLMADSIEKRKKS